MHLRDPMALSGEELLAPVQLIPLLALSDGQRDLASIRATAMLMHGLSITQEGVEAFFGQLDQALLLEGSRFEEARGRVLEQYRSLSHRKPALAGPSYPADPLGLESLLDGYMKEVEEGADSDSGAGMAGMKEGRDGRVVGVLSPHIDYQRGHKSYAKTWRHVEEAARECELAIVLGTDHAGGDCKITPTLQSYATPWGPLPTDRKLVETLVAGLGGESAFEEEEHHIREHSVELALVWLHYMLKKTERNSEGPMVLPILCGHMGSYVFGDGKPEDNKRMDFVVSELKKVMQGRKTLVIAAGDLAHVGPAFGDPSPWGHNERASLRVADESSLDAICAGDAERFLEGIRRERDQRRVCGLTPIYLALQVLGKGVSGRVTAYDQCPADPMGGSLVSIAGVIWQN